MRDGAERFAPDRTGRAVAVVRPGDGARIEPRSLVRLEVSGLDPADGAVVGRHEILALVPPLGFLPGYSFSSSYGPELSGASRNAVDRRGVGRDPAAPPALVTHWGFAPLPWPDVYRMRVGGVYELPHPTPGTLRGLNEASDRRLALARPELPRIRLAVLATCRADLRRIEHTHLEWNTDFIQYPRGFRTETWHELHGCAVAGESR